MKFAKFSSSLLLCLSVCSAHFNPFAKVAQAWIAIISDSFEACCLLVRLELKAQDGHEYKKSGRMPPNISSKLQLAKLKELHLRKI